jgi:hypothetical protein
METSWVWPKDDLKLINDIGQRIAVVTGEVINSNELIGQDPIAVAVHIGNLTISFTQACSTITTSIIPMSTFLNS